MTKIVIFSVICKSAYEKDKTKFEVLVLENKIHKSDSRLNPNGKDPIITNQKELVQKAIPIEGSIYFTEVCISGGRARFYAKQVAELFGFVGKVKIEVRDR